MRKRYNLNHRYRPSFRSFSKLNALQKKRLSRLHLQMFIQLSLFLVIGVCLMASYQMLFFPRIMLEGDRVLEVEYQDKYSEPGYISSYRGKDISSKVKVTGKVDTSKVGEYPVVYQVFYEGKVITKTRIVKVVDSKGPSIEFTGNKKKLYICPNQKYLYDDYKATDNYDGDITSSVKVVEKNGKMRYQVKDSFGNQTEVFRDVFYEDVEGPSLTLDSGNTVVVTKGDSFQNSTYQVEDNCGGDVDVSISGDVDMSQVGEYEKIYKAVDKAGNATEVKQKVVVMEPVKKGVIYLTFDDGPRSGTTDVILNVLKEKGVHATFFVTSGGPDDLIKRMYDEGHSIGLHTASHDYSVVYGSIDSYFNDLKIVSDRVEKITGEKSMLIRFPGGSSNTISKKYTPGIMSYLTREVVSRGYRYYDWNIDSHDAEGGKYDADEISEFVISNLSYDKVNMVLMHDVKVATKDAVGKIIDYGLANGYSFETIGPYTDMVVQRVNN